VWATGRHAVQRERALALGADAAFASAEEAARSLAPDSIDCAIETVGGRATTLAEVVRLVRVGASVAMLGVFTGDAALPGLAFSAKELRLVGSNCYGRERTRSDFTLALELLAAQHPRLSSLVTHRLPLAEVNRAFELAADKASGALKVHVDPRA
jgi:threonine dehydrogenase-like Zn-dependent dehydrogenase